MRKPVLILGLVLWIVAGVSAYWTFSREDSVSKSQLEPGQSAPSQSAAIKSATERIVNPDGKQSITIRVEEPEVERVAPADWQPPIVEGWTLTNQAGETVTPDNLRGKPYVGTFIFTRCQTHCPDLVRRVYDLEQRLKDVDVRFVTVSVDPDHDTVEHLAKYAEIFSTDPDRWMFLTGSKEEILNFAIYGSRQMRTEPLDAETFIGPQAAHSLRLMHVGADGRLVGSYHFQKPEDMLALRRVLEGKSETRDEHKPLPTAEEMVPIAFFEGDNGTAVDVDPPVALETTPVVVQPRDALAGLPAWAKKLPALNASMNGLASIFLICGFVAIKRRRARTHRSFMMAAIVASAVFLAGYVVYHIALGQYTTSHGKPFEGVGVARTLYFGILIPHVVLAATVPFFVAITVFRAYKQRWDDHKRIAKVAYPVWMFVSVTGVIIYAMLYHWPSPPA